MARVFTKGEFFEGLSAHLQGIPTERQELWMEYKYDPVKFVSECCYTITDVDPPNGVFKTELLALFAVQADFVNGMVEIDRENDTFYVNDSHVEKSRQMGMSWILMAIFGVWVPLFWPGMNGLAISRKEKEVDDGGENSTTDSMFGKARFMYDRLPSWLKPKQDFQFKLLTIRNPNNGSYLRGDTANPNAGRGGTYKFAVCDEWAFVPNSELVWSAISRACPRGKILNSTPFGSGNHYARMKRQHVRGTDTGFKFFRLHWSQHPLYSRGLAFSEELGRLSSPWYESQIRTMTPEQIARELEINYARSVTGLVYPEFSVDDIEQVTTEAEFAPEKGEIYLGWDFGLSDPTAVLLCQKNRLGGYDVFQEVQSDGLAVVNVVPQIKEFARGYNMPVYHWGDPAGNQREKISGSSIIEELGKHGIVVNSRVRPVVDGISLVRTMHRERKIRVHPRCLIYIECKENYHYPLGRDGTPKEGAEIPVHDWSSHMMDAERYLATGIFEEGNLSAEDFMSGGSDSEGHDEWVEHSNESDEEIFGMAIDSFEVFGRG